MNIVVCLKQTLETAAEKKLTPEMRLQRTGAPLVINTLDEYALEAALQLKETLNADITALSMGPESAQDALRQALASGADNAVLVTDPSLAGSDWLATARVLAAALKKIPHDLIIMGLASDDAGTGVVPAGVGELLGYPVVSFVNKISIESNKAILQRRAESGYTKIEAPLPCLITVTDLIGELRSTSVRGIMQSKKKPLDRYTLSDLGLSAAEVGQAGAKERVTAARKPEARATGAVKTGLSPEEAVREIIDFMVREKLI